MIFYLILLTSSAAILFIILFKYFSYFSRNGIAQSGIISTVIKNFSIITSNLPLAETLQNCYDSFPNHRYFGMFQLFQRVFVVRDPELIKEITISSSDHFVDHGFFQIGNDPLWDKNLFVLNGNEWKYVRSILSSCFTSYKLKLAFDSVLKCAHQFVIHFDKKSENENVITINSEEVYARYSFDVIISILLGYSCDSIAMPDNDFYVMNQKIRPPHTIFGNIKFSLLCKVPIVAKFFGLSFYTKANTELFFNILSGIIKDREKQKSVRADVIQILLDAKRTTYKNDNKFSIEDVAAHILFFFLVGVETSAALLSFTSFELACHVDVQKRLQNEIDECLASYNGRVTYEALQDMKYLDMVLSESLRKWPITTFTDRKCTKPYVIQPIRVGEAPVYLKKGDSLWIPIYCLQRDPRIYANPEMFDPERFNSKSKHRVFLPFGAGPRICIGQSLALLSSKLLLVQVLAKFDIVTVEKTKIPIQLAKFSIQLMSQNGLWLGLRPRQSKHN